MFVCWRIIITIGIYERHQAFSGEERHLKVTPGGITSDCEHTETMLSDKLSPLTQPFKSSPLLCFMIDHISAGGAAAYVPPADSDNQSGSKPSLISAAGIVWCFCFAIVSMLMSQASLKLTVIVWMSPLLSVLCVVPVLECFMISISLKQLVRMKSPTIMMSVQMSFCAIT